MSYKAELHHDLTPYLIVKDAAAAIEFYKKVFGATELMRLVDEKDNKTIRHAEIMIGDSPLMLVDETPYYPEMRNPKSYGGSPIQLYLYVEDVDALCERAVAAGANNFSPIKDSDDGERRGGLEDPFGFVWWISTKKS